MLCFYGLIYSHVSLHSVFGLPVLCNVFIEPDGLLLAHMTAEPGRYWIKKKKIDISANIDTDQHT